ncbi:MAG: CapA family protein [Okeania sp. SIO2G4]|uniref:CapA family protein n=1 Tax=unclassified Okeania TaxID=2634635 RepID=UPI0013BAEB99|nr:MULTISPECIES: CapA family protein [unclassified Okeania]NEP38551.1 CapA family protein [Okeania sp. SIO2H7]NEP74398.1 CapA family protein [Okeania sp. SIO2G5]NEP95511.1 CapA family protein [Okeania sp. SIO2F5]NEQ93416.1 CapA family protein [Okeania sp. SIO2G4]
MSQQEILTRAKQGDPKAIAFLINQALTTIGVKARVSIQKNNLHLLLESSQLPDRQACIRVIHQGMQRLNASSIDFVNIYGRRLGNTIPEWTEVIELHRPSIYHPAGVGTIWWQSENTNSSQESLETTLPSLSQQVELNTPEIVKTNPEISKSKDKNVDFSPVNLKVSVRKRNNRSRAKKIFSSYDTYWQFLPQKNQALWLLVTTIGIALIPVSNLVLNSNNYKLPEIISNISRPQRRPQKNSSTVEVSQLAVPTVATPQIVQTQNKINLSEVSEFVLSSIKSPINPDTRITIKAVGDIIPGTNYPKNKLHPKKQELFASVKPLLQDADIVFGNFESTLTSYPRSGKKMGSGRVFAFRTPPNYRYLLKDAGFDVLSVANNHSFDFLKQGFEDTIANIQNAGMQAVGKKGEIVYREVKGINIAFIAFSNYSYHNSMLDLESAKKLVREADENADIIVISVHAGAEGIRALRIKNKTEYFFGENRGNKILFSHTLIDEGADLILAHGPHVPRAMEVYQGKLIAYSLGNFMGYRTLSSKAQLGYSLVLEVDINPRGDFVSGKILPVHLNSKGIPYPDKYGRSIKLIQQLTKKDFPKTILEIDGEGKLKVKG